METEESKNKLNAWNGLSLRIIALFATAMLLSYSPALLRGFFEDTYIPADAYGYRWGKGFIDTEWNWGYRHYLYFLMCMALFCVQACRLFKWIGKHEERFVP